MFGHPRVPVSKKNKQRYRSFAGGTEGVLTNNQVEELFQMCRTLKILVVLTLEEVAARRLWVKNKLLAFRGEKVILLEWSILFG